MASVNKTEKLEKVLQQITTENEIIAKAKLKIKKLNITKKKLEQQITNEQYAELKAVLHDYGIKSVTDFQNFIDNYGNTQVYENQDANNENASK